jgi:ribosomal protein L37AE/L43A
MNYLLHATRSSMYQEVMQIMVKRICPNCGANNYSANTEGNWACHTCKGVIPKPKEVYK